MHLPISDFAEVKISGDWGRGVFATRAIEQGAVLGTFAVIPITKSELAQMKGTIIARHCFEGEHDAAMVLGFPQLLNHSLTPNVDRDFRASPIGELATFRTIRAIKKGEELLMDYRIDGDADAYFRSETRAGAF